MGTKVFVCAALSGSPGRATKVVITLGNVGVDDANHFGSPRVCLVVVQRNVHGALELILFSGNDLI